MRHVHEQVDCFNQLLLRLGHVPGEEGGVGHRMHCLRLKRRLFIMFKRVHQNERGVLPNKVGRRCVLFKQPVHQRRVLGRPLLRPQGEKHGLHRL